MDNDQRLKEIKQRLSWVNYEIGDLIMSEEVLCDLKLSSKGEWDQFRREQEQQAHIFSEFFEEDIPWLLEKAKGA